MKRTTTTPHGVHSISVRKFTPLILVAASVYCSGVPAQERGAKEDATEEIVVTGSRLRTANDTQAVPVQAVSAERIAEQGTINIGSLLRSLPAAGGFQADASSNLISIQDAGVSNINLRGLGSSRTLVLVNGRRHVAGQPGSSSVDLNTIPSDMIDRIEVVTGGASAIYGSDAIAGVVNIILKNDFSGFEVNGQFGADQNGDGERYKLSLIGGTNFADDRGNATAFLDFNETTFISTLDRDFSKDLLIVTDPTRPDLAIFGPAGYPSTRTNQGVYSLNANAVTATTVNRTVLPDGTVTTPNGARDGLNFADYYPLALPTRRLLAGTSLGFQVSDSVRAFFDATYARSLSLQTYNPTFLVSGRLNIGGTAANAVSTTVPVDNPFIPADMRALIPAGRTIFGISRDFAEFGPRRYDFDRDMLRGIAGLEGEFTLPFSESPWSWEAYFQAGRTSSEVTAYGGFRSDIMYEALRVEPDGLGGYRCRSPTARAQGCIPVNLFTGSGLTEVERDSMATDFKQYATVDQQVASASASGSIFSLPAGDVGLAVGLEWRKEKSDYRPDDLYSSGISSLAFLSPTSGEFKVKEAFIETKVPVLHELGVLDLFEVEAAYRYADYSTTGAASTWKYGGSATLFSDLRLRAIKARAVRAPNISELYAGDTASTSNVLDPCTGGGNTPDRQAHCLAQPGITTAFAPSSPYPLPNFTGGNPNLDPENADTLTYGLVYHPRFLQGASLSVDFFEITLDNAITTIALQTILDRCADTNDVRYCSAITRNPTNGLLQYVNRQPINVASESVRGVDVALGYSRELGAADNAWGTISGELNYTHMSSYESTPFEGAPPQQFVGRPTFPEDEATLHLSFSRGPIRVALEERYRGKVYRVVGGTFDGNEIDPAWYTDAQFRYAFTDEISAYIGGDNLFDQKPPLLVAPYVDAQTGTNTPYGYDVIGRFFYAGMNFTF